MRQARRLSYETPLFRQRALAFELGDRFASQPIQLTHRQHRVRRQFVLQLAKLEWRSAEPAKLVLQSLRRERPFLGPADWPMWDAVTTDLAYARLHGHAATYSSAYGRRALAQWANRARKWLSEGREVHVYFDNTDAGHALTDAAILARLLDPAADTRLAPSP